MSSLGSLKGHNHGNFSIFERNEATNKAFCFIYKIILKHQEKEIDQVLTEEYCFRTKVRELFHTHKNTYPLFIHDEK